MAQAHKKYKKYKIDGVVYPHKHCPVCNKMVQEEGGEFGEHCSAECAGFKKSKKKKSRKKTLFMIGGYAIMIIIFIVITQLI